MNQSQTGKSIAFRESMLKRRIRVLSCCTADLADKATVIGGGTVEIHGHKAAQYEAEEWRSSLNFCHAILGCEILICSSSQLSPASLPLPGWHARQVRRTGIDNGGGKARKP